jgi:hypothetical protein
MTAIPTPAGGVHWAAAVSPTSADEIGRGNSDSWWQPLAAIHTTPAVNSGEAR